MEKIQYYVVTENTDKTEGRGISIPTNIAFKNCKDALMFVASDRYKKFAVMGCVGKQYADHYVNNVNVIVYDNIEDYDENSELATKEKIRCAALSKLTDEEKEALGL